jgi:hypothetical protein
LGRFNCRRAAQFDDLKHDLRRFFLMYQGEYGEKIDFLIGKGILN